MSGMRGFVLLEALISLLIFSLGMLGLLAFHAVSAKMTTESALRTDASLLVDQLIGRMRAADPATFSADFSIGGRELGIREQQRLKATSSGVPDARINKVDIASGPIANSFNVTIEIAWSAPGQAFGSERMRYATTALI